MMAKGAHERSHASADVALQDRDDLSKTQQTHQAVQDGAVGKALIDVPRNSHARVASTLAVTCSTQASCTQFWGSPAGRAEWDSGVIRG